MQETSIDNITGRLRKTIMTPHNFSFVSSPIEMIIDDRLICEVCMSIEQSTGTQRDGSEQSKMYSSNAVEA